MTNSQSLRIGGKSVEEWDRLWKPVEGGLKHYHPELRHRIGLCRFLLGGTVMAIAAGTEWPRGLAKRLSDFSRPSSSGRNHHAGQLIYEHRHKLKVEVLILGESKSAGEIAPELKDRMIEHHRIAWSKPGAFVAGD